MFCTTYALILPAITMEKEPTCGFTEHEHSAACFSENQVIGTYSCLSDLHVHEDGCFDSDGNIICGYADFVVHSHGEFCFDENGDLICELPEILVHTHDEDCFAAPEEAEAHEHTENCFTLQKGELLCDTEEYAGHTHEDICVGINSKTLICTVEESEGHVHTEACEGIVSEMLSCELEESEGHSHSGECYQTVQTENLICGSEEYDGHVHDETCIGENGELICETEETEGHSHSGECYELTQELVCELNESEGHAHGDNCYTVETGNICGLEESEGHIHNDDCYEIQTGYICGHEEAEGHIHNDECYEWTEELICDIESNEKPAEEDTELEAVCGYDEIILHEHDEIECFDAEGNLICGQIQVLEHIHSESCIEESEPELVCELKEHIHDEILCYIDSEADIENADVWEATLPEELSGNWAADLIAVAQSQLDYTESETNVLVGANGEVSHYSRYGAWFGRPYAEWNQIFLSFCLNYAGIPEEAIPQTDDTENFISTASEMGILQDGEYTAQVGDIAVLCDEYGVNTVGIITDFAADENDVPVPMLISGDINGEVVWYESVSENIIFYISIENAYNLYNEKLENGTIEEETAEDEIADTTEVLTVLPDGTEIPEGYTKAYSCTDDENAGLLVTVYVDPETTSLTDEHQLAVELYDKDSEAYQKAGDDLSAQEIIYDDYIAMDIHFIDGDGNEFPVDESVYVVINANGMLPEEARDDSVAVQHHTEKAESISFFGLSDIDIPFTSEFIIECVADMFHVDGGDIMQAISLVDSFSEKFHENTRDIHAAFNVNDFSTFTITWENNNTDRVTVYYVNGSGNEIAGTQKEDIQITGTDWYNFSSQQTAIGQYTFTEIRLDSPEGAAAVAIRYDAETDEWYYRDSNNAEAIWTGGINRNVYLVFTVNSGYVETVDMENISISLFDYSTTAVEGGSGWGRENRLTGGINDQGTLQFVHQYNTNGNGTNNNMNIWTGYPYNSGNDGDSPRFGIVSDKLVLATDNKYYPTLNTTNTGYVEEEESLKYLFDSNDIANAKTAYTNLTGLFYMENGYYVYDSAEHFARLNGTNLDVYEKAGSGTPKFAPFNQPGNTSSFNYHFGMTAEFDFMMPAKGQINGEDMIFEFTGDDDVWVFIDETLVLDIGGIHGQSSGSINFNTGEVLIYSGNTTYRTLNLWEILGTYNKWDDYTIHSFNFYYLERGQNESNCKLKFNLPSVPARSVTVGKTLSYDDDAPAEEIQKYLANQEYSFRVMKTEDDELMIAVNTPYEIWTQEPLARIGSGVTDDNGIFKVQPGQLAIFPDAFDVDDEISYYVQELVPIDYSTQYAGVSINGSTMQEEQNGTQIEVNGNTYRAYIAAGLKTSENNRVIFDNTIITENLSVLTVMKDAVGGDSNTQYPMYVYIDGEAIPAGTTYTVNMANGTDSRTVQDGGIIELADGEYTQFQILAGSTYEVIEYIDGDSEFINSYRTDVTCESEICLSSSETNKGTINHVGDAVTVTVINTYPIGRLELTKILVHSGMTDEELNNSTTEFNFTIKIPVANSGSYDAEYVRNGATVTDSVTFTADDATTASVTIALIHNETVTILGLPEGITVEVLENNTDGYNVNWTGDGVAEISGERGTTVTTNAIDPDKPVSVTCTNQTGTVLPETGGIGTFPYTFGGLMIVGASGILFMYKTRRRQRG